MKSKFHVTLLEHSEGVSVSCPELPGCHSQGATVAEALENIRDAIQGYLELYGAAGRLLARVVQLIAQPEKL
jgi:predicted RNase H-like HicB family nuclease